MSADVRIQLPVEELTQELTGDILPYWMNKMVDKEHGGFYGRRNGYDELDATAGKGIILNTRILWIFSSAARMLKDPAYRETADRAYRYICDQFIDRKNGGVYWMLDYKGNPAQTKKQIYAQAFAIYAFTEYFLATGIQDALNEAIHLFELIERYSFDQEENGYLEAFDEEWNLLEDLRLSDKDANEKKTMNTHLHVLEAYTLLFAAWKNKKLENQLRNLIVLFKEKIINTNFQYDLFFDEHWKLQSEITSFGHDIEGSWLLCAAAEVLDDDVLLNEVQQLAINTVNRTLAEGLDTDGGLMNETNPGKLSDTDKHWWPQAEALVGLANAWQINGNDQYLKTAAKVWSFIKQYMIDKKNGEWYWRVDRDGNINYEEDKAGPWKCPYHNGRAVLEIIKRIK